MRKFRWCCLCQNGDKLYCRVNKIRITKDIDQANLFSKLSFSKQLPYAYLARGDWFLEEVKDQENVK